MDEETPTWYYIKNWWKYQHYKDRNPPWIKLHKSFQTDPAFQSLSEIEQWRLVKLWIVASDMEGRCPRDERYMTQRWLVYRHSNAAHLLAKYESLGLISKQDIRGDRRASASTKRQKQRQKQSHKEQPPLIPPTFQLPDWIPEASWNSYLEMRLKIKKPMTDRAKELAITDLEKLKDQGHDPVKVIDQSVYRSWQGFFPLREAGNGNGNSYQQQSLDDRVDEALARRRRLSQENS